MFKRIARSVYQVRGREFYYVQYIDPWTKKPATRSTKKREKKAAERWADEYLMNLQRERPASQKVSWKKLCEDYCEDKAGQRSKSLKKTRTAIDAVEQILKPKDVRDLTTSDVRQFKKALLADDPGRSSYTIAGYLASMRTILRWAKRHDYIDAVPHFEMPSLTEPSSRAPTDEEFRKLRAAVPKVVGKRAAAKWESDLEGLWWSGLRLSEAGVLQWNETNFAKMWVDIDREHPLFFISAQFDKKGRRRGFAMSPEFADHLRKTPASERTGFVFNFVPWGECPTGRRANDDRICRTLMMVGETAKVVVARRKPRKLKDDTYTSGVKYASAHDCRRAFCVRWASRVLPPVLMEMARHDSMQTTMRYYVGRNAELAAKEAWEAYRKHLDDEQRAG